MAVEVCMWRSMAANSSSSTGTILKPVFVLPNST